MQPVLRTVVVVVRPCAMNITFRSQAIVNAQILILITSSVSLATVIAVPPLVIVVRARTLAEYVRVLPLLQLEEAGKAIRISRPGADTVSTIMENVISFCSTAQNLGRVWASTFTFGRK
jgi:hypothetical protein